MLAYRVVRIADLYLCASPTDWSYRHLMADPRAHEVEESAIAPAWVLGDMAPGPDWRAGKKGLPMLVWAAMHFRQQGIDFDFLDIGANIGMEGIAQATLHKRVGWHNKVYLFEPGRTYPLICKSAEYNNVTDIVTVMNVAVSDTVGKQTFFFLPNETGGSSLLAEKNSDPSTYTTMEQIDVDTTTVDAFVSEHLRAAQGLIAKVDTEGADFKVLAGMKKTMAERTVTVQFEFIPELVENYTNPIRQLEELATEFFIIDVGQGQVSMIVPQSEVASFTENVKARKSTDVFLLPRDMPYAGELLEKILCG